MRLGRRALLVLGGLAVLGFAVPACRRMLWQILVRPRAERRPPPPPARDPFRVGDRSPVALVHGGDVPRMVRRAVDLLGGLQRLELGGRGVLVKPNVVSGEPPPATTDPRVVRAVLDLVREARAASLALGDMSAVLALPTRPNLERTGLARVAAEAGAALLAFEEGEWVEVSPPRAELARTVFVARAAYEAERLVSVPVIKTHRSATFSCALKNSVGCVHGRNKPWAYGGAGWEPAVAELNLAVRPHLYVVDGLTVMVAGGPWAGEPARTDLVLAGGDPVALDAVALGLLRSFGRSERVAARPVWESAQLRRAIALGLGARGPAEVALRAETLGGDREGFRRLLAGIQEHAGLAV